VIASLIFPLWRWLLPCLILLGLALPVAAQEFLDPLVAFKPEARALDDKTVEVRYSIAKGYYLYRDKFRLTAESGAGQAVPLGAPQLPKGKEKQDDTFGKVEVFYKEVRVRVPVERSSSSSEE